MWWDDVVLSYYTCLWTIGVAFFVFAFSASLAPKYPTLAYCEPGLASACCC
jgi:hypothetical protein